MDQDDDGLIRRFLAGDAEAVATVDVWLVRAASPYRRRLFAQWEDVLQQARLEVTKLLQRGTFRGESSLKTYLWQVANHTCLYAIRAHHRAPVMDAEAIDSQVQPESRSPFNRVRERESAELVRQVVREAAPECRSLWGMIQAGLSYQEMSARLGASEGALRVRVLRCRRRAVDVRDRLLEARINA